MNGANVTIQDEDGNAILLYDNQLKEGYAVGDTIVLSGTKTTYNGHPEIKSLTSLTKIEKYGRLPYTFTQEMHPDSLALKGGMTHSILAKRGFFSSKHMLTYQV